MIRLELTFDSASPGDSVSAILFRPDHATHLMVLAHGAGAGMRHRHMTAIAEQLGDVGIATLRYNFPFMEKRGRIDSKPVCTATVRTAVLTAGRLAPDLILLAGGHSFGGRMTSTAASESPLDHVRGLVCFSFPLHPPGKPGTDRADHLSAVTIPMLFLNGTRDTLAERHLMEGVCRKLPRAALHFLDTADHSFRILKRSRRNTEDAYVEAAGVVREWVDSRL